MRIYDVWKFNYNQILFKDTWAFLEALLAEQGCTYRDVAFHGEGPSRYFSKILEMRPRLNAYWRKRKNPLPGYTDQWLWYFTSMTVGEDRSVELLMEREDVEELRFLIQKIPRPLSFTEIQLYLDGIDWYGDGSGEPIYDPRIYSNPYYPFADLGFYFSNGICMSKLWASGNKYNCFDLLIDRTGENGSIRPLPPSFENIVKTLGKPIHKEQKCIFTREEDNELRMICERVSVYLENVSVGASLWKCHREKYPITKEDDYHAQVDSRHPVSGYSPKKCFTRTAERYGYRYVRYRTGEYLFAKKNEHGHEFRAIFRFLPLSYMLEVDLSVSGHTFTHALRGYADHVKEEQRCFEFAEMVFATLALYEKELSSYIFEQYGGSPSWFGYLT